MAVRDWYLILGIARDATPPKIRSAYRRLAKALHPDLTGESGTRSFQDLNEAYATLSDPERRFAYDRELEGQRRAAHHVAVATEGLVTEPLSLFDAEARHRPSLEAVHERFLRNFTGLHVPKGEVAEGLNVQVLLTAEEAAGGVVVPIDAPTVQLCPFCEGSGRDRLFPCLYCREEGRVARSERVHLRVPPMVRSGTVHEFPLDRLGVHNFYLRVHILVDDRL
jgi:DnaJ-class molecular chaperone